MNELNMAFIQVDKRRYALDLMNPLETITFANRVATVIGPVLGRLTGGADMKAFADLTLEPGNLSGAAARLQPLLAAALGALGELKSAEVTAIMLEAVRHCYTPQNEPLSDTAVFNRWFREHPGDMYPLGAKAVFHLVKDFFPSGLITGMSRFQTPTSSPDGQ